VDLIRNFVISVTIFRNLRNTVFINSELNGCFFSVSQVGTTCALSLTQILTPVAIAPSPNEWMHKMTHKTTRIIATITLSSLLSAAAAAAADKDAAAESTAVTTVETAALNRNLAASATTAAAEDAIEAVLAANKLDLDIRFIGRTSGKFPGGR